LFVVKKTIGAKKAILWNVGGFVDFCESAEAPLKDLRLSSSLTLSPHEVSFPDNLSGATAVWTAETLHGWWTLRTPEPMGVKLSLKLLPRRSVTTGPPTVDDGTTGARRE
jgi:hypothetical protein